MSRLRELMEEFCPGGVEYKKLGEIAEIIRGNGLQKKDFVDQGIGCIHYGQIYTRYGAFADRTLTYVTPQLAATLKTVSNGDLVVAITSENVEDVCKCVAWLGEDDIVTGGHAAIVKHKQNPKYLAYLFQTEDFFRQKRKYVVGTKVIEMSPRKLAEIIIPVPPLEIQNEIVKLLDNFTELTAELTAELTLRKKQYNFYRDSLLNFVRVDDTIVQTDRQTDRQVQRISKFGLWRKTHHIEWKRLRDVSVRISSGGTPRKTNSAYYNGGTIPWLRTQEVEFNYIEKVSSFITEEGLRNSSAKWIPAHCVIVAISGATAGRSAVNNIPVTTNQHCCNIEVNEEMVEYKYVFYWVKSQYEKLKGLGRGARADLSAEIIANYPIPVPPLEVQQKIASILDRFDTLCNDLTSGLPAEIAARKKQYEHYRDRLLTFPRSKLEERS